MRETNHSFYNRDSDGEVISGFPSPADPYLDFSIDLNIELGMNRAEVFLVRAMGEAMAPTIKPHDLLVVDRLKKPQNMNLIICWLDGEFFVKRLRKRGEKIFLTSDRRENKEVIEVDFRRRSEFKVWGVVTNIIRSEL